MRRLLTLSVLALITCLVVPTTTGCAAVKPLLSMLAEYGLDRAEDLARGGRRAIEEARCRALEIPIQLDRFEALAEIMRAEQIYQTRLLERLAANAPELIELPDDVFDALAGAEPR
jgi:hypothetical protein